MTKERSRNKEALMVPQAKFESYYGKAIVKAAPWGKDIPAYLFLGGLAGGSSLLAAGADLVGNGTLRRNTRLTALAAIGAGYAALVHDLGRASRFGNMLRVAKPSSPMSVGTWIITLYGPAAAVAAGYELRHAIPSGRIARIVSVLNRPAGLSAAALAPLLASYTAVLLSNTATPAWHHGLKEMPFVFAGSAASAAGGMAMITSPRAESTAARRLAVGGAIIELVWMRKMERSMGMVSEVLRYGRGGQLIRLSRAFSATGAIGTLLLGRKSRAASVLLGLSVVTGSALTRFGLYQAGQDSAEDPKYTVIPQKETRRQKNLPGCSGPGRS